MVHFQTSSGWLQFAEVVLIDGSLATAMQFWGGEHADDGDSALSLTAMTVVSELPDGPGWEPGRFHLLSVGVFITLVKFLVVFFTGRIYHGGTAPMAPEGEDAPDDAYRLMLIAYPPKKVVEGGARHSFAALPHQHEPLYVGPEISLVQ